MNKMSEFLCKKELLLIGTVGNVDTNTIIINVSDEEKIKKVQVNQLIAVQSSKVGQYLISMVSKIISRPLDLPNTEDDEGAENIFSSNIIKAVLIGTFFKKNGVKSNVFKRSLSVVPSILADCYLLQGDDLKIFMSSIAGKSENRDELRLGTYSIDNDTVAFLNGDKFFQRHAIIVGSTGSGKSWCVAKILEQVAKLNSANAILFDIHGEYSTLNNDGFSQWKIAGPNDSPDDENIIFLPYWFLTYEEMLSMILDRSDNNAPNQAMLFSKEVLIQKKKFLDDINEQKLQEEITVDSPVPYNFAQLLAELNDKDTEMVDSSSRKKQGPFHGKLTRFIQRLEAKKNDKRLNFMFNNNVGRLDYLNKLCKALMVPALDSKNGVKIIDFSEVPSDILPLISSLIARIIFSVQQWMNLESRTPIAIFCDEAHLYISSENDELNTMARDSFKRISKEGRKYGIGLVIITQRPSEVDKTVLSQCNNFIAMRLTNNEDQNVIKRLLPDSLGNYTELLPILDVGEAIVVGDSCLLPSKIRVSEPTLKPLSATFDFWDEWCKEGEKNDIDNAVSALRIQTKIKKIN